jgi:hypothetical protein
LTEAAANGTIICIGRQRQKEDRAMKFGFFAFAVIGGIAAAAPVGAQVPGGGGVAEVVNEGAPSQDKVICRTTGTIGTRLKPTKKCMTAKQWETDLAEQRRTVEKGQNERVTMAPQ